MSPMSPPSSRIIPARAGSTVNPNTLQVHPQDHPRSCGEHLTPVECERLQGGSSPLVRGALKSNATSTMCCRIIPARAGSTEMDQG